VALGSADALVVSAGELVVDALVDVLAVAVGTTAGAELLGVGDAEAEAEAEAEAVDGSTAAGSATATIFASNVASFFLISLSVRPFR
jgi:hypothetical protein